MAFIGLKDIYTADITEDSSGNETYSTPVYLAPAISADIALNFDNAKLRADDKTEDAINEFVDGTITVGVSELGETKAANLTGATVDSNGLLIDTAEDQPPCKALGFKAKNSKGKYYYVWLYRVMFSVAQQNFATKGENITFSTPSIVGTIMPRNKVDSRGNHPWRASVTDGATTASASTISTWFSAVPPEPTYAAQAAATPSSP